MSLPSAPLFESLAGAALRSLESEFSYVSVRSGEALFSAGDPGDALYVVVFGRLRALRHGPNGDQILGEVGQGETVGEMAVLTGEPRWATVYAVRDTQLLRLSKAGFERIVDRHPHLMLEVTRQIIARYQRVVHPSSRTNPVAIALVPCHRSIPLGDFAAELIRALSPGRRVLGVDAARVRAERGTPTDQSLDLDAPDLAGWLHQQERAHGHLIYVADPAPSPWTRLCIRQADLVLLVGAAGAAATMEPELLDAIRSSDGASRVRAELVLLYDSQRGMPHGTAEWLARVAPDMHHHLDPDRPRDYDRLARTLTGRAIGLVLGGGGARGLAHIGVIRALEEAGIPIDLVGGTSIGAIIGGQCASGWESARIMAESRRVLVEDGSLNDFTVPVMALLHGRRFFRMLEKLYADRRIEDLPLPYFCASTNLTRSACMVHRTGPLCKWVAASMAVPGLGPPIFDGTDILVDGGVLNNLPVDVMRGFGRGPVFASSVSPAGDLYLDREYEQLPSPWRLLASWLNPFGAPAPVPTIGTLLMRTVSLQGINSGLRGRAGADLLFEPPPEGHKLLDWVALDSIVETGYRTAIPVIERWLAQERTRTTLPAH